MSTPERTTSGNSLPLALLGIVLLLVLPWALAVHLGVRSVILPPFGKITSAFLELAQNGTLLSSTLVSLGRVNGGFLLALVTAVPLGMLLGRYKLAWLAFEPIVESFRFIIPFAWIPLAVLWFGTAETGKLFIIWYAGFFLMLLPTIAAVRNVDPDLIKAARTLGAGPAAVFVKVVLPAILPELVIAMRVAFAICWISVLAAELAASRAGLGYMISDAREMLETDVVMVGMIVIGCIGAAYNFLFRMIERRLLLHRSGLARV
jgi:ABC-type nitrate/sulfonate/bicarbonate transport system permease component